MSKNCKISKIIGNNQFRFEVELENEILKLNAFSLTCFDNYFQQFNIEDFHK